MAEIYNTESYTLLSGTSDADYIQNGDYGDAGGDHVTIKADSGNDSIYNFNRGYSRIFAGDGDDSIFNYNSHEIGIKGDVDDDYIENYGESTTIDGGEGADTFIYNKGEGKDVITDFADDDLLQITGTFSATYNESKNTIAFKVGTTSNAITLKNFTASTFNINGDIYAISGKKLIKQ